LPVYTGFLFALIETNRLGWQSGQLHQTVNLTPAKAAEVQILPPAPMNTIHEIELMIRNEPLLAGDITLRSICRESLLGTSDKTLMFGTGLCTDKQAAAAIPFDVLSFFFLAEKLRRELDLTKVIVLIADHHALTNNFMNQDMVNHLKRKTFRQFRAIVRNFHLADFEIICGSDLANDISFREINRTLPPIENKYLKGEMTDILWLMQERNLAVKLGWTIDNAFAPSGHDERFFDSELQKIMSLPLSFIFAKAGRTFDPDRPKSSPYISVSGETRLLLTKNEKFLLKLDQARTGCSQMQIAATVNHLADIVRLFEKLFIKLPDLNITDKIQFITDIATNT
jgi:hypothetical protein